MVGAAVRRFPKHGVFPRSGGALERSTAEKDRPVSSAPEERRSETCFPSVFLGTFPVDDEES